MAINYTKFTRFDFSCFFFIDFVGFNYEGMFFQKKKKKTMKECSLYTVLMNVNGS